MPFDAQLASDTVLPTPIAKANTIQGRHYIDAAEDAPIATRTIYFAVQQTGSVPALIDRDNGSLAPSSVDTLYEVHPVNATEEYALGAPAAA